MRLCFFRLLEFFLSLVFPTGVSSVLENVEYGMLFFFTYSFNQHFMYDNQVYHDCFSAQENSLFFSVLILEILVPYILMK